MATKRILIEYDDNQMLGDDPLDLFGYLENDFMSRRIEARLPGLLAEFKSRMLAVGFLWPEHKPAQV